MSREQDQQLVPPWDRVSMVEGLPNLNDPQRSFPQGMWDRWFLEDQERATFDSPSHKETYPEGGYWERLPVLRNHDGSLVPQAPIQEYDPPLSSVPVDALVEESSLAAVRRFFGLLQPNTGKDEAA